jgi:hypothetical protein
MGKIGTTELLDIRESQWASRLRAVSLAAEVTVEDAHSEQVANALGTVYEQQLATGRDPERMFERWPACVVVAVTAVAIRDYAHGAFWPWLWQAVRYPGESHDAAIWGDGFSRALGLLWLPTFPFMPTPYIGPILMHSGMPTSCVEDFLYLLLKRWTIDAELDAESFMSWANGHPTRLDSLDIPARRFLQYGTDYAFDVVDRSLDMLRRLQTPQPDLEGLGLPRQLVTRATELIEDERLNLRELKDRRRRPTSDEVVERPRLRFDPFGRGVEVALPAVADAQDGVAVWSLTIDGTRSIHRSQAAWHEAASLAPATTFAMPYPSRTVVVTNGAVTAELPVVDPKTPILAFSESGRLLPSTLPLPPDIVWLVHPDEHPLLTDGPQRVVAEGQLAPGWNGWRSQLINLESVRSIRLDGLPAARREVRGFQRPRIDTGSPLIGVITTAGAPVFKQLPTVWLPGGTDAETAWTIEVRRSGEDDVAGRTRITARQPTTADDIWAGVARPVFGTYEIVVRGPLGRGTSRTVFIADKVEISYLPTARPFNASGVIAGRATVTVPVGMTATPAAVQFAAAEVSATVELRTASCRELVVVSPPHPEVLREQLSGAVAWSAGPLRLTAESFHDDPGTLLVRSLADTEINPIEVLVAGKVVQELQSRRLAAGTARYDLGRVADTIAEHHQADLVLRMDTAVMPLAFVRPRRAATSVRQVGDVLVLGDAISIAGLTASVYPIRAPWRMPSIIAVEDGVIALPPELLCAGPLSVHLQIESPWTYTDWPRWPKQTLVATADGHLRSDDAEETVLSRFLAGVGPMPSHIGDLTKLWVVADLGPVLRPDGDVAAFLDLLAAPLRAEPHRALHALADAALGAERSIAAVIGTGIASCSVPGQAPSASGNHLWSVLPIAAALLLSRQLSDDDCRHAAEEHCGDLVSEILTKRVDADAQVGRFGEQEARFAEMPPEQLAMIWRAANVVPQTLLDPDSRVVAARRLFDERTGPVVRGIAQQTRTVVQAARKVISRSRFAGLLRQIDAREHPSVPGGWVMLPAMSTAMALLARLAARGDGPATALEREHRDAWRRLASVAPELTTIDLVLAELLVAAHEEESA